MMGHIKKIILITIVTICSTIIYSQEEKVFVCDNVLFYNKIVINKNNDTLSKVRVSTINIHEGVIHTEQTLSLLFLNDSLIGTDFERNPNYGRKISSLLEDSCKLYDSVTVEYLNKLNEKLIFNLLNKCQYSDLLTPYKSKIHFNSLQKLLLILNNKNLDFLLEYCMYINLDLISLELHLSQAKVNNDKKKLFFISQAYRMNKYDEVTKIYFEDIWLTSIEKYGYDKYENLFSKRELKKIAEIFNKKSSPFELKSTCWFGFL